MKTSVRITLVGTFAGALMVLSPYSTPPAHALAPSNEINLNSSKVQVVHNTPANTDVLNMSLNVESDGDSGSDPCDGEEDDLLETGVHVSVSRFSCSDIGFLCPGQACPVPDFEAQINYVEHEIGGKNAYGTSYAPNAAGAVASKIVSLPTPPNTCGTWTINLQATGQNLSAITGPKVSLSLNDFDRDGFSIFIFSFPACFDVDAIVGNGIVKPHRGVRRARR